MQDNENPNPNRPFELPGREDVYKNHGNLALADAFEKNRQKGTSIFENNLNFIKYGPSLYFFFQFLFFMSNLKSGCQLADHNDLLLPLASYR